MPAYTPTTWVNGTTALNATNMNHIETQLSNVQYGINIIAPFQLANNVTINSGSTNTYTCTGVGGVPSGAVAVFCNLYFTPSAAGTFASITPHGTAWSNANYPIVGAAANATNAVAGSILAVLSGGQIDVKANNGNLVGLFLQMYAYIY